MCALYDSLGSLLHALPLNCNLLLIERQCLLNDDNDLLPPSMNTNTTIVYIHYCKGLGTMQWSIEWI